MENYDPSDTNDFVHDERLDCSTPEDDRKKELQRLINNAELTDKQQEQLRQASAHYAVRTAPVPEEDVDMRARCLLEAIVQSDLPAYDAQAIENRGVSFGIAEGRKAVVYVNDSPLTESQLEGAYQFISMPDDVDLEAVRIAFDAKQAAALEAAYAAPAYDGDRQLAVMEPAIEDPSTISGELKPVTSQLKKLTKMILDQLVGIR